MWSRWSLRGRRRVLIVREEVVNEQSAPGPQKPVYRIARERPGEPPGRVRDRRVDSRENTAEDRRDERLEEWIREKVHKASRAFRGKWCLRGVSMRF